MPTSFPLGKVISSLDKSMRSCIVHAKDGQNGGHVKLLGWIHNDLMWDRLGLKHINFSNLGEVLV